jgi:hypothetical protein
MRPPSPLSRLLHALAFAGGLALAAACAPAQRGAILGGAPEMPRSGAHYVIYLHPRIVEQKGPRPTDELGTFEYRQILDALAASGAQVIHEQRPAGTDFREFGARVAGQVRRLREADVPAERIAVVGFSKGGAIAMIASALLREPEVRFVLLGACGDWVKGRDDVNVWGRILSIYEASDTLGTSCEPLFAQASAPGEHREIRIATGAGHGAFYRPRREWLGPTLEWVRGPRRVASVPSPEFQPPKSWEAGVKFVFRDPRRHPELRQSTRVTFASGGRRWTVTDRDLFMTEASEIRTPWYPLRPQDQPVDLHITVEHEGGVRTVAQFPLSVRAGGFYAVSAGVYTLRPTPGIPPFAMGFGVSFPLHPRAPAAPGDSLWVGVYTRDRGCFDCPT